MKLSQLRERCRVEDGHWLWTGATSDGGVPRVWAPDYTKGGKMTSQTGRRAAWHLKHRKPLPQGWRVFATCTESACVNPAHSAARPVQEQGAIVAESGKWKGSVRRIAANRAIGRRRSSLTPELFETIKTSEKSGQQIARENGLCRTTVSRVRRGKATAFEPVGGLFTGLLRAAVHRELEAEATA